MSEKRYVYANIKLPIELINDSYELHSDLMTVEFEKCEKLPDPIPCNNQELLQKIFSLHPSNEVQEEIMKIFSKDFEKSKPKNRQNTSFKKTKNKGRQYTRRTYDPSL